MIWFSILKTTLNIDDSVMQRLREESARRGTTMSALVEAGAGLGILRCHIDNSVAQSVRQYAAGRRKIGGCLDHGLQARPRHEQDRREWRQA